MLLDWSAQAIATALIDSVRVDAKNMLIDSFPHPPSDRPVLVGYSGGLDSTVLLHWLARSNHQRSFGLTAIHVNHGLHPDADLWADHCRAICIRFNIPLHIARVRVSRQHGGGIEDAARHARRAAFAQRLDTGHLLALAHHLDDQAETWLLRALRGSGADGLAAMRPLVAFGSGDLWRPFLSTPRTQLRLYAQTHGLNWIDDPSNQDTQLDRNYIRLCILPALAQRWPQAAQQFGRCAQLCADATDLLTREDDAILARMCPTPQTLNLADWSGYPSARRARLLRRWCVLAQAPPLPAQGVATIEREVLRAPPDRQACFRWQHIEIRCWRQTLYLRRSNQTPWPHQHPPIQWDGTAPLALPSGGRLDLLAATGTPRQGFPTTLTVRPRVGGERIQLAKRQHTHALKQLLQAANIPPWHRQALPLLYHRQTLWAAGDVFISAPLASWLDQTNQQLKWVAADALSFISM